ncbi:MAG: hypothetical protein P9M01_03735 [Candidatus Kappaea frigidicola]|nr:hypothetical protein [Candidatus Kappaea frigidicola]
MKGKGLLFNKKGVLFLKIKKAKKDGTRIININRKMIIYILFIFLPLFNGTNYLVIKISQRLLDVKLITFIEKKRKKGQRGRS